MKFSIAVKPESEEFVVRAQSLAIELSLPIFDVNKAYSALLLVSNNGLSLQETASDASGPLYIDFVGGAVGHRLKFGGGKGQMLAKAVGVKGSARPSIVDVTAGMGRDGFILASLGCDVQMVERVPVIAALLRDGLRRASESDETKDIEARVNLHEGDAADYLESMEDKVEVIYMDPMFPHRQKSALVKKEMRIFKNLAGADEDADKVLEVALKKAAKRVVIKRPRKSPYLCDMRPSYSLEGKANRFDVHIIV